LVAIRETAYAIIGASKWREVMGQEYATGFKPDERSPQQQSHEKALERHHEPYDPAMHSENLYDLNEGAGGEVIDLQTGKPIDNSTETDETLVTKLGGHISDRPTPIDDGDDAAARWLAEHDKAA
jgi:hypothetical protein